MTFLLRLFALTALLAAAPGAGRAQDGEPAAEKTTGDATAQDQGSPKTARRARHGGLKRVSPAARRAAMDRAGMAAPSPSAPEAAPQPVAVQEHVPAHVASTGPIDARASEAGVDSTPAIAPAKDETTPDHEVAATGAEHEAQGGHGEHGAGHGEHAGFSAGTFALQLVNFGVLLFILIWFGGRAMNKALRARHEQLKGDIQEASRLRDEAAKKFQAQEQRVVDLEKEIAALRATMQQQAEQDRASLLAGAQERAKRIQDDMRFQLDQQVKEAELLLRAEVASASVKLAEELLRKSVNADDERRLAREFVAGFDGPTSPANSEGSVR